ncbi:hypothetical protein TNCV_3110651 [Trichonephila clavipes]|nr:hypothetical protein TNCV_3110651 [Trichonephila clavipes]
MLDSVAIKVSSRPKLTGIVRGFTSFAETSDRLPSLTQMYPKRDGIGQRNPVKFTRSVPNFLWRYYRASVGNASVTSTAIYILVFELNRVLQTPPMVPLTSRLGTRR